MVVVQAKVVADCVDVALTRLAVLPSVSVAGPLLLQLDGEVTLHATGVVEVVESRCLRPTMLIIRSIGEESLKQQSATSTR